MKIFTTPGAARYVAGHSATLGGSDLGYRSYSNSLGPGAYLWEGTEDFEEYRASALREADRCLFFSASHYRRALDLMRPSSAHWASVTSYYGAYFAANGLLHMFGAAVLKGRVVIVDRETDGAARLLVKKIGNSESHEQATYRGSHQQFWELFYRALRPLSPEVDSALRFAVSPVSGNPAWLTEQRNRVNYDTLVGLSMAGEFEGSFGADAFPAGLPATLSTHFRTHEALLVLGLQFASEFKLVSGAFSDVWGGKELTDLIKTKIYETGVPGLVRRTKKAAILAP